MIRGLVLSPILNVLAVLLLCLACGEGAKEINIGMELVKPIDQDPFLPIQRITFMVIDADDSSKHNSFHYQPSGGFGDLSTVMSGLELYKKFFVTVGGTDVAGELISRGKSVKIDSGSFAGKTFAVYFALARTMSVPPLELHRARVGARGAMPNGSTLMIIGGAGAGPDSHYDVDGDLDDEGDIEEEEGISESGEEFASDGDADDEIIMEDDGETEIGDDNKDFRLAAPKSDTPGDAGPSLNDTEWGVEIFTPPHYTMSMIGGEEGEFTAGTNLIGHTVTAIDGISVLVAGGKSRLSDSESFHEAPIVIGNYDEGEISAVTLNDPFPGRINHQADYMAGEGRVLISGGEDAKGDALADCAYVLADGYSLVHAFDLKTPRKGHTQTVVTVNHKKTHGVLFYGGAEDRDKSAEWLPVGGAATVIPAGAPKEIRKGHRAIALADERVLILGGLVDGELSASGLLFTADCVDDDGCEAFTELGKLLELPRREFTLSHVSDDFALACGGWGEDDEILGDCELFKIGEVDEITHSASIEMAYPRVYHEAVYLPDGTVMLIGGYNRRDGALRSFEIFMPGTQ